MYTKCRISSLALAKMSRHAAQGGAVEVMGMLLGSAKDSGFDLVDCFALPVEATETRVNAMNEAYEYIVQHLNTNYETGHRSRDVKVVGWYHSHPGYGCFLSRIDMETQSQNQQFQDPFVAVVIDPVKTLEQAKVEIGAFRTKDLSTFYSLDIEYYGHARDMAMLTLLDNKTWTHALSQ